MPKVSGSFRFSPYTNRRAVDNVDEHQSEDKQLDQWPKPGGMTDEMTIADTEETSQLFSGYVPSNESGVDSNKIENVPHLVRPFSFWTNLEKCDKLKNWLSVHTFNKIIAMRDGTRMDETGFTLGDRDFQRMYHQARDRCEVASTRDQRVDIIKRAFREASGRMWHRWMFPFGSFVILFDGSGGHLEQEYKQTLRCCSSNPNRYTNPYGVAYADVWYLLNCGPDVAYLERYLTMVRIIVWAKKNGVNLLEFRRYRDGKECTVSKLDELLTLERIQHVLGSTLLHIQVIKASKENNVWGCHANRLTAVRAQFAQEFGLEIEGQCGHIRDTELNGQTLMCADKPVPLDGLTRFFRRATRASEMKR